MNYWKVDNIEIISRLFYDTVWDTAYRRNLCSR